MALQWTGSVRPGAPDPSTVGIAELQPFPPLACSVRDCGRPLALRSRALACPAGHSFDLAASGYVNLLQPGDRRSLEAGDSKEQVEARERCFQRGIGPTLYRSAAAFLAGKGLARGCALEVGCGSGSGTPLLDPHGRLQLLGLDLSQPAIERAAKRRPELGWIVANADRRLPIPDASLAAVITITGPKNVAEFARVLGPGGLLLAVLPGAEDLVELREKVQGEGRPIERLQPFLAGARGAFEPVFHTRLLEKHALDGAALRDLLTATYRAGRRRRSWLAWLVPESSVTTSYEILILKKRGASAEAGPVR